MGLAINKQRKILFFSAINDDEAVYFCDIYHNALFKMDLQSYEVRCLVHLPSRKDNNFNQYSSIGIYKKNLFIIAPRNAKNILLYNKATKEMRTLEIDLGGYEENKIYNLFSTVIIYNDYAFLFPGRYDAIVKINLRSYEITYIREWTKLVSETTNKDIAYSYGQINVQTNKCYIPCSQESAIIEFNLDTEETTLYKFELDEGFSDIVFDGKYYWISSNCSEKVIQWDGAGFKKVHKISVSNDNKEIGIKKIWYKDDHIYFLLLQGNCIYKFNPQKNSVTEEIKFVDAIKQEEEDAAFAKVSVYCCRQLTEERIILSSVLDETIKIYDTNRNKIRSASYNLTDLLDKEVIIQITRSFWKTARMEEKSDDLEQFFKDLSLLELENSDKHLQNNCGKKLFYKLKEI